MIFDDVATTVVGDRTMIFVTEPNRTEPNRNKTAETEPNRTELLQILRAFFSHIFSNFSLENQ